MTAAAAPLSLPSGGSTALSAFATLLLFLFRPITTATPWRRRGTKVASAPRVDGASRRIAWRRVRREARLATAGKRAAAEPAFARRTWTRARCARRTLTARVRDVHHQATTTHIEIAECAQRLIGGIGAGACHEAKASQATIGTHWQVNAHRSDQRVVGEQLRDFHL